MSYFQNIVNKNIKRLQILRDGQLTSSSPKYTDNIDGFKLPLKDHQLTLLHSCLTLEKSSNGLTESENLKYQSNIGIIADDVGGGKSISVLALISSKPTIKDAALPVQFINYENMGFIVYAKEYNRTILNGNLIIVPHSIFLQWDKYIKKFSSLTTLRVNNTKSTNFTIKELDNNTVYLVSNTFIVEFLARVQNIIGNNKYTFQRVFVDEADNIRLTTKINPSGLFNWFITSSVENLIFPSGQYTILKDQDDEYSWFNTKTQNIQGLKYKNYIRNLFECITNTKFDILDILGQFICRNQYQYIQSSFQLELANIYGYLCKTPAAINYLSSSMTNQAELMNFINANDITALKEKLGFKVESGNSISQMLTSSLQKTYNNELKHYKYIDSLDIEPVDKTERLAKIQKKLNDITSSINHINSRMIVDENNICPICHDNFTKPICSVVCCGQLYCMGCISGYFNTIKTQKQECPCCRATIGYQGITIISDEFSNSTPCLQKELSKKEVVFEKLIRERPESKWLIFSGYDGTFNTLINKLECDGITFEKVMGTNSHIENLITDFKNGKIRVLLLNAFYFGMGLNLECATDILIYHTLNPELERQVIGRAQRPGRASPLNIHLLCHDNEMSIYQERFTGLQKIE